MSTGQRYNTNQYDRWHRWKVLWVPRNRQKQKEMKLQSREGKSLLGLKIIRRREILEVTASAAII